MEGKPEFLLHYPNQIHCHYPWLGFHLVIINSIILFSFTQTQNLLLLNTFQGGNVKKKMKKREIVESHKSGFATQFSTCKFFLLKKKSILTPFWLSFLFFKIGKTMTFDFEVYNIT